MLSVYSRRPVRPCVVNVARHFIADLITPKYTAVLYPHIQTDSTFTHLHLTSEKFFFPHSLYLTFFLCITMSHMWKMVSPQVRVLKEEQRWRHLFEGTLHISCSSSSTCISTQFIIIIESWLSSLSHTFTVHFLLPLQYYFIMYGRKPIEKYSYSVVRVRNFPYVTINKHIISGSCYGTELGMKRRGIWAKAEASMTWNEI